MNTEAYSGPDIFSLHVLHSLVLALPFFYILLGCSFEQVVLY